MRTIKFRGKILDGTRNWVYGTYSQRCDIDMEEHTATTQHLIESTACHEVDPETIGQFTECRDVLGRDIYEGDTLRLIPKRGSDKDTILFGTVRYFRGSAIIEWITSDVEKELSLMPLYLFYANLGENEVFPYEVLLIGNIYDTPSIYDLLTAKNQSL